MGFGKWQWKMRTRGTLRTFSCPCASQLTLTRLSWSYQTASKWDGVRTPSFLHKLRNSQGHHGQPEHQGPSCSQIWSGHAQKQRHRMHNSKTGHINNNVWILCWRLYSRHKWWPTRHEKVAFAIVKTLTCCQYMLEVFKPFHIYTDHRNLVHIFFSR